jgi:hypothetical protein
MEQDLNESALNVSIVWAFLCGEGRAIGWRPALPGAARVSVRPENCRSGPTGHGDCGRAGSRQKGAEVGRGC